MNYLKNIRFERSIGVELKLTTVAAQTELTFQDVPQLQGAYIQAIEAFTDTQVTKTPTGNTVFAAAAAKEMLMRFQDVKSDTRFQDVPYFTMISSNNGGLIREFNNMQININKSSVLIGGTTATPNHSLFFVFYYSYNKK